MDREQEAAQSDRRSPLEQAILDALVASGKDIDRLSSADLASVDEFHLGARAATAGLAADLKLAEGMQVLDIGAGIGGPARYFAEAHGCSVVGIDQNEDFARVADALTARCGLADRVSFRPGSALALPFSDESFDRATLIHVGMNVEDKARLFAEARRVLKPSGVFGVYDVMIVGAGEIPYPMPWAMTAGMSFLATPAEYRGFLSGAGFAIEQERDWRDVALELGRRAREKTAKLGAPALGLHLLMGPASPQRLANVMSALERGVIAPKALIARAL